MRELDPDALATWLQSEGLALVLRDGALIFTDPQCLPVLVASVPLVLRQHVEAHRAGVVALLIPQTPGRACNSLPLE